MSRNQEVNRWARRVPPARVGTTARRRPAAGWRPRSSASAVAAAVVAVAVITVIAAVAGAGQYPTRLTSTAASGYPDDTALGVDAASARCVEDYNLTTLDHRDFAFDGVVTEIATPSPVGAYAGPPYARVTFDVQRWFQPLGPDRIEVMMLAPGMVTSVGTADYAQGSRLLISGESRFGGTALGDPIASTCGFSRTFDPAVAAAWAEVFEGK